MFLLLKILLVFLVSIEAFASGGFTFLSSVAHATHVPEHVITLIAVSLVILALGVFYRSKVSSSKNVIIPDPAITSRNLTESTGAFIYNLCKSIMGEKEANQYFGVISMLFILIFLSNFAGLIPGFLPPTENLNTTLALGLFVFIYYNFQGIRAQGLVGHIKHFMGPVWYLAILILPIEIVSHTVRPISLGLRLRSVMMGDHLVLGIFSDLAPIGVPVAVMCLGLFICFIQAFVFSLLTMVYISLATAHHDHDEEHAH